MVDRDVSGTGNRIFDSCLFVVTIIPNGNSPHCFSQWMGKGKHTGSKNEEGLQRRWARTCFLP
jgi:hypothetical protein